MPTRDIVVIGASAGGVKVLMEVVPRLAADLAAAVFIVMHLPVEPLSILHELLQPTSRLPVLPAVDGATVRHGVVTVAVNDQHLVFADGRIRLTRGPRENRARPAIDATLRSAAMEFGPRCIGVILTGALDDGTAGLWAIKDRGGVAVVQSPADAEYQSMPASALKQVAVEHVVRADELPALLTRLTREAAPAPAPPSHATDVIAVENRIAAAEAAPEVELPGLGAPSMNTCPHCRSTLVELRSAGPLRFRCHTGHMFSPGNLLVDLDRTIDDGLWSVLRSIEERQLLLDRLIVSAQAIGNEDAAQEYARQSEDARQRGDEIRLLALSPAPAVRPAVA